jgi:predicted nucleic acid-binding protein
MATAIDTNIIVALWHDDSAVSGAVEAALEAAFRRGSLAIAAPVFAELIAAPGRTEDFVNAFLSENRIAIDWNLEEPIWRAAGRAFQGYAERRRRQGEQGTRRLLADFLIGAHAEIRGYRLLSLDERIYRAAFPALKIETI